jgi:DNA-binding transcriptional regulator GbsR (MarR family)
MSWIDPLIALTGSMLIYLAGEYVGYYRAKRAIWAEVQRLLAEKIRVDISELVEKLKERVLAEVKGDVKDSTKGDG